MSLVGDTSILIRAPELRRFAAAILQAAGVSGDIADEWAKCLVWANLRGTDSHGVLRIPRYIELLAKNAINSAPMMRVERRAGAISLLEADLAPGPAAMSRAMKEAIACARDVHIGWCAARNITQSIGGSMPTAAPRPTRRESRLCGHWAAQKVPASHL